MDDEEAIIEMGEDILTELGYEVTSRMNGKEALSLLTKDPSRFDLVITDVTRSARPLLHENVVLWSVISSS